MDYEKKYKQLHTLISDLYPFMSEYCKEKVEDFFPEIRESDDEKIRKEIIALFKGQIPSTSAEDNKKFVAWLEKQGEQVEINPSEFDLRLNKLLKQFENLPKEELASSLSFYLNVVQNDGTYKPDEKQGGQKPILDFKASDWYVSEVDGKIHNIYHSVDKVESKFKVGDWITNGLSYPMRISSIDDGIYYTHNDTIGGDIESMDKEYHLWTIDDAKDGDVLVASDGSIFIFNSSDNDGCKFYVAITVSNKLVINRKLKYHWETSTAVHPATKEQRDTLAKAMLSLGYTFDFDKKELKKIELQPYQWDISDFRTWQYIVSDVLTKHDGIGQYLDNGFCRKIAQDMQNEWSKKLRSIQHTAWSEEDEKNLEKTIWYVEKGGKLIFMKTDKLISWLKSLKDRIQSQSKQEVGI